MAALSKFVSTFKLKIPFWTERSSILRNISVAYPFPATSSETATRCTTLKSPSEGHFPSIFHKPVHRSKSRHCRRQHYHFPQEHSRFAFQYLNLRFPDLDIRFATVGSCPACVFRWRAGEFPQILSGSSGKWSTF